MAGAWGCCSKTDYSDYISLLNREDAEKNNCKSLRPLQYFLRSIDSGHQLFLYYFTVPIQSELGFKTFVILFFAVIAAIKDFVRPSPLQ